MYVTLTARRPAHRCHSHTMHGRDLAPIGCLAEMNYNVNCDFTKWASVYALVLLGFSFASYVLVIDYP